MDHKIFILATISLLLIEIVLTHYIIEPFSKTHTSSNLERSMSYEVPLNHPFPSDRRKTAPEIRKSIRSGQYLIDIIFQL
jgi:hypothetical protein